MTSQPKLLKLGCICSTPLVASHTSSRDGLFTPPVDNRESFKQQLLAIVHAYSYSLWDPFGKVGWNHGNSRNFHDTFQCWLFCLRLLTLATSDQRHDAPPAGDTRGSWNSQSLQLQILDHLGALCGAGFRRCVGYADSGHATSFG
jgi:hypothetical protein